MAGSPTDATGPVLPALVWSKLQAPVSRRHVLRPALVALCSRPDARLVLVRAPAGWGKSTLLADWSTSASETRAFCWVSLDRGDNDPVRFWTYLIQALRTRHPSVGTRSLDILAAPRADVVTDVLPELFTELAGLDEPAVLVLDDYHLVTNPAVDAALSYLVEHLPDRLCVAVASRSEPGLPLARMRARGQLVEVGADKLAFTEDEASSLLNDLNALGMTASDVRRLHARTEGWAAGLYLAALSMRGHPDPASLVDQFTGTDRHVVDYLSAEVIAGQPTEIREFLRATAHLTRLSADLCDAVTGRDDAALTLRGLEAANTFLVPLDNRREWYRYHHLFAELLKQELPLGAEARHLVHRRAADWYDTRGLGSDAIRHATAAGDVDGAARLILTYWPEARDRARLETLVTWVEGLPRAAVRADPRLCLVLATTLQEMGRLDEADRWLAVADEAPMPRDAAAGPASLAAGIAACRAINCYFRGDATGIMSAAGRVSEHAMPDDPVTEFGDVYWSSALFTTLGAASFVVGRTADSEQMLRHALRTGRDSGHHLALVHALGWYAVVQLERGCAAEARQAVEDAESLVEAHPGLEAYFGAALVHVAGAVLAATDRPGSPAAESAARRGIELARRGRARFEIAMGYLLLADILTGTGRRTDARAALEEARRTLEQCPDPGRLPALVADHTRRVGGPAPSPASLPFGEVLSDRELAVLRLLRTSLSQREIGEEMHLSFNTVKTHVKSIFRKLDVTTRQAAVDKAQDLGLL